MKLTLPIQTAPFRWHARRLSSGRGTLQSVAVRTEIISPIEEDYPTKPTIFLPDQADKITKTMTGIPIEEEWRTATATRVTHLPTIAYHIENATLLHGSIYARNLRYWIRGKKSGRVSDVRHLRTAAVASTPQGSRWFGHWLTDDCLTYELARDYDNVICVYDNFSAQQTEYETYFAQDWAETGSAIIDRLTIFDDLGQNSSKRKRHAKLSAAIQQRFGTAKKLNVYLRRGKTGTSRLIANETEIIENLVKRGFVIADIETDSLERLLAILCNADMVISVEGSHVSHCCYSFRKQAKLLLLQPADRFCLVGQSGWISSIGATQGFVVGEMTEDGYLFPIADILKTADLLMNH